MSTRGMFRVGAQTSAVTASKATKTEEPVISQRRPVRSTLTATLLEVVTEMLPEFTPRQHQEIAEIRGIDVRNFPVLVEVIGYLRGAKDPNIGIAVISDLPRHKPFDLWSLPHMEAHEKQYRQNIKMEFAKRGGTVIRDLICPKCRGNEYSVTEAQLSAADESNTEFRVCIGCMS
ncbi:Hypothetical protein POVR1_LOCUS382 [uncultured virus]|nr:Hypothetical protein POVR1_LOCUS382 [uncultured virus]